MSLKICARRRLDCWFLLDYDCRARQLDRKCLVANRGGIVSVCSRYHFDWWLNACDLNTKHSGQDFTKKVNYLFLFSLHSTVIESMVIGDFFQTFALLLASLQIKLTDMSWEFVLFTIIPVVRNFRSTNTFLSRVDGTIPSKYGMIDFSIRCGKPFYVPRETINWFPSSVITPQSESTTWTVFWIVSKLWWLLIFA